MSCRRRPAYQRAAVGVKTVQRVSVGRGVQVGRKVAVADGSEVGVRVGVAVGVPPVGYNPGVLLETDMPTPLVECIPNFSEARRPEVVEAILAAITGVAEISLLNHSSDSDHNRSVVTFAGPPAAVEEAAFQAIRTAAGLINLDQHSGSHPRLGATDVVPFVPISGISMEECVQMARRLGERVGRELDIPVYLYEAGRHPPGTHQPGEHPARAV